MKDPELQYYQMGEGVTAFSSTRMGGYSEGSYGEFNINPFCGDSGEAIRKNREILCRTLGIGDSCLLLPHQIHKAEIAIVGEEMMRLSAEERKQRLEGVDALMTDLNGVCIGVSTADCIPVLLYDPRHKAVCAVHAGWRGTVQRIVEKAVAQLTRTYRTHPADITAQIGPGIHQDSFEVGDEVYEAFAAEGFDMLAIGRKQKTADATTEKWHIDLPECNRRQLIAAGVSADRIQVSPVCTFQQSDTWFSARRLGILSGRIYTGILIR